MSYSKIRLKTATAPGTPPDAADLDLKEIAFDGVDALYIKRPSDGAVVKVGGAAPRGGDAGQVLTKKSAADGDIEWKAVDALPTGGTTGQILTKTASGASWSDVPIEIPAGGTIGQILTKTATGLQWTYPPSSTVLPADGSVGQVLTKTATGYAWMGVSNTPLVTKAMGTAPPNGTITLDRSLAEIFTLTANTSFTIALSGAPAGGDSIYILRGYNFASASNIIWPANTLWVGGTQPAWSGGWDEIHLRRNADGSRVLAFGFVGA